MIDLNLFRDNRFLYSNLAAFFNFAGRFSLVFLFPFYLVDLRGMEPSTAGLMMTPVPLIMAVVAPYSGSLSDRIGTRLLTTSGMVVTALGFSMLFILKQNTSLIYIISALLLMGVGGGMFSSPNTSTIMGSVPKNRLGNAGGMASLVRNIGMIVGVAWSGALFHALAGSDEQFYAAESTIPALLAVMKISVILILCAAMFSFLRKEIVIHRK